MIVKNFTMKYYNKLSLVINYYFDIPAVFQHTYFRMRENHQVVMLETL